MKKEIIIFMKTLFIAQSLKREIETDGEYRSAIISEYENPDVIFLDKYPSIIILEAKGGLSFPIYKSIHICEKLKTAFSMSHILLFITANNYKNAFPEIINARRNNFIDAFLTADSGLDEVMATIKSLA